MSEFKIDDRVIAHDISDVQLHKDEVYTVTDVLVVSDNDRFIQLRESENPEFWYDVNRFKHFEYSSESPSPLDMQGCITRKKIYIAGPMRGIPLFNFPAFDVAEKYLTNLLWSVRNPAEMDRERGFDPATLPKDHDWSQVPPNFNLHDAIKRDLHTIIECDAIYMLKGWEKSRGARCEYALAEWLGLEIFYQSLPAAQAARPAPDPSEETVLQEAQRITGGDRQAQYGAPDQDFTRTAAMWTALFSDMLLPGVQFSNWNVAQAQILLKMSRQMHQRKRDNWTDTAGYARCGSICDKTGT